MRPKIVLVFSEFFDRRLKKRVAIKISCQKKGCLNPFIAKGFGDEFTAVSKRITGKYKGYFFF